MLDVVRGWCMFFIAGGDALCLSLCLAFPQLPFAAWVRAQLDHVQWEGFTFYDGLFPTFLLISGAAFTYSWRRQERMGIALSKRWLRLACRISVWITCMKIAETSRRWQKILPGR
jgi:predicted acyltransferase